MKCKLPALVLCFVFLPLTSAQARTRTFQPNRVTGKDASIFDNVWGADTNRGNDSILLTNTGPGFRNVGLLEFDVSSIARRATVNSATLTLHQITNRGEGDIYNLYRVTSPWEESTVTWNNAPTYDPTPRSTLVIPDNEFTAFRTWDVTNIVQEWVSLTSPNYGFWLEEFPPAGDAALFFASSDRFEREERPKLTVTFTPQVSAVPEITSGLLWIAAAGAASTSRRLQRLANFGILE